MLADTAIHYVTNRLQDVWDAMVAGAAQLATIHQPTEQAEAAVLESLGKVKAAYVVIHAQATEPLAEQAKAVLAELVASLENHIQTVRVTVLPVVATMVVVAVAVVPAKAVAGAEKVQSESSGVPAEHIRLLAQLTNHNK